jgi:hypothetical protein
VEGGSAEGGEGDRDPRSTLARDIREMVQSIFK